MQKIIFAALLITFLAFSGYHLTFKQFKLPLFARKFYLTGTEFLFFGLLLGPHFFNIIDIETLKSLDSFTMFLPGWIGLLFGLQFDILKLRRFPIEFLIGAIIESVLTFIIVFTGISIFFAFIFANYQFLTISTALTLASAAACTAPTGLALMTNSSIVCCQNTVKLLQYISSIDGIIALLIYAMAFFFHPFISASNLFVFEFVTRILITLVVSAGFIILFSFYLSWRRDENELILITLGMIVLMGGAAMLLNFSPLLLNFIVGFFVVNISREKERLINLLMGLEKPVYLLLLIFLGVSWHSVSIPVLLGAAAYCLFRIIGKITGGYLVTRIFSGMQEHPPRLGFGLLSPGGLPMAIFLDFQNGFPNTQTSIAVSLALIAVILNDIISPHMLGRLLIPDNGSINTDKADMGKNEQIGS
ncbi:sodium/solute symporter domain-containing protein [Desulfonema limicola]|uniref:Sodium/solute symporter domain-containing protein n=1 Tax=Desulfonema limicola TaxID=45656 RepID=A0A975B9U7_9BACT|nr:hypothetical protein [Desulfonema limicola]QTA81399.1 sodium/solute symporter domain-containing protein [Desulfonema limicola]